MGQRNVLAAVAISAFCAGVCISFFTLPTWVTFAINAAKDGPRTDWLGFAGSVFGGFAALFGAIIAWFAVQAQIAAPEEAKIKSQSEAKLIGYVVLAKPVHAASAVLYSVQVASAANTAASVAHWDEMVNQTCAQLSAMLEHFAIQQVAADMEANDRIFFLMVILHFATVVSIYRSQFGSVKREARLEIMTQQLWDTKSYLSRFNEELWRVFDRDARLPGFS